MAEKKIQIVIEGVDQSASATLRDVKTESDNLSTSLQSMGESMQSTGSALTDGLTKPLVGIAEEAIGASTELNGMMANVQSLGLGTDRVVELKGAVQDLAIDMGKNTSDMAGGLYQVVSAFGDSSDAVAELEVAAKAGAAGLASTEDAINLISSVTKGYGDTSLEAQKKVSDLAFQTVALGQTTFPELAASMGKVVPMAAALGVSQEELFAQMSTLTGVTGGAAEVSTQLRATYQALLKPTTEMGGAIAGVATQLEAQGRLAGGPLVDAWLNAKSAYESSSAQLMAMKAELDKVDTSTKSGAQRAKELKEAIREQEKAVKDNSDVMDGQAAALGPVLVNSIGLTDTLKLLSATAGGNTDELGKMFGSVESLNAVLALSGGQADSFQQKLTAMGDAAGLTDKAFEAQTQGLNKNGFTWEQLQVKVEVLMQKLGDGLAPALSRIFDIMQPLIDQVMKLADWFANADSTTQTWIVGIVAAAAAIGPLLAGVGMLVSAIGAAMPVITAIGGALALLTGPIGLVVAGVGLLALAIYEDWGGIGTFAGEIFGNISTAITSSGATLTAFWEQLKTFWEWLGKVASGDIELNFTTPQWIVDLMDWLWPDFVEQPGWVKTLMEWLWPEFIEQPFWAKTLVDWLWPDFLPQPAWVHTLVSWAWPAFIGQPGWVSTLVSWMWPGFIGQPGWLQALFGWDWPSFTSMPGWVQTLFDWDWPGFPSMPAWLSDLLNWQWPSLPDWMPGSNAEGTPSWRGGLTWVGEKGPELVSLPRGTRIYNNRESMAIANGAGGMAAQPVVVNVYATVRSDIDVNRLAYEVADVIRRAR